MLKRIALGAALLLLFLAPAQAAIIVLDFEGLGNREEIGEFYNGGFGGDGNGPGPDFDLSFGAGSLALIDADAGGTGNFGGEPSPDTAMFFLTASPVLNVPNGFDTGFSLFYTSPGFTGNVRVFSGLNATGAILLDLFLPTTPDNGAPDPNGRFSPFVPIGGAFAGIGMSVEFGGTADQIAWDDFTFGSDTPGRVPVPSALILLGTGIGILGLRSRRS